jgi:hypothetical protein
MQYSAMTVLPAKTVVILFAACFAVLQMLQFEVLQSPEQHISLFHTADDFPPITAQQALNNLNSTFYQNSLSEQKYKFIQDVINPANLFSSLILKLTFFMRSLQALKHADLKIV